MAQVTLSSIISQATRAHTAMAENKGIHSVTHERVRRKVHGEHEHLSWGPRRKSALQETDSFMLKCSFLKGPHGGDCLVRGNSAQSLCD